MSERPEHTRGSLANRTARTFGKTHDRLPARRTERSLRARTQAVRHPKARRHGRKHRRTAGAAPCFAPTSAGVS